MAEYTYLSAPKKELALRAKNLNDAEKRLDKALQKRKNFGKGRSGISKAMGITDKELSKFKTQVNDAKTQLNMVENYTQKERGDKKMMGGGSLKMDKMKMAGGGMMEDMKAAGMKMADGGKMPMDAKTGKPAFAVDGKGKMGHGGMAYGKKDKMGHGGMAYGKNKMMDGGTIARGSGAARPQKFRKNG